MLLGLESYLGQTEESLKQSTYVRWRGSPHVRVARPTDALRVQARRYIGKYRKLAEAERAAHHDDTHGHGGH